MRRNVQSNPLREKLSKWTNSSVFVDESPKNAIAVLLHTLVGTPLFFNLLSTDPMIPPAYLVGTAAVTENLLKRRWSAVILRHLADGICDPTEICRKESEISTAAMNERLRNMLRFNLIGRYPRASPSKIIEYRLTARGQKVLKILNFIDQLDAEASQHESEAEEKTLVTIRRTKVSPSAKKRIVLDESPPSAYQTKPPQIKYA